MGSVLTITAVGDISMGDHPVCVGHGMRSTFKRRKAEVLHGVEKHLKQSDITLANLESVVSDVGLSRYWLPSIEMRGDPGSLKYLKSAGFNLLGVANNHAMQHGIGAFRDCVTNLYAEGFGVIGLEQAEGRTKPYQFTKDGLDHVFFAISLRPEKWHTGPVPYSRREYIDIDTILEEVGDLRKNCNGFLVCSIHWGLELLDHPGPNEVSLGRALIDSGVDVIFGHHSHLLWPIERYKGGLIFYSLGNFTFDLWSKESKLSAIVTVVLEKGLDPRYSIVPVVIQDDFTLALARGRAHDRILERLSARQVERSLTSDEYDKMYNDAVTAERPKMYQYFLRNFYRYSPNVLLQSLFRTLLRRLTGS